MIHEYCSYCDFTDLDPDPQDCTCDENCTVEGCSGESEAIEDGTAQEETSEYSGETE